MELKNQPLITVYIPTYNRVKLLKRAIRSVQDQTYKNLEIIIVDDCSNDGTHEYLKEISELDSRIKYYIKEKNSGACVSRNIAINNANGYYVTGLDDDDYLKINHIDLMLKTYLLRKEEDINHAIFPSISGVINGNEIPLKQTKEKITIDDLIIKNFIGNQCFTKKDNYLKANLFDEHMPAWQDYDMWVRMTKIGVIFYKASNCTYLYDVDLSSNRISDKGYSKLENAYNRFISKNFPNINKSEKLIVKLNLYSYAQVPMSFYELIQYLGRSGFMRATKIFIKKLFVQKSKQNFT